MALADRSVCAGDLAERLTAEAGIDYRRAHGAVGRLVAELEAQQRFLADATAEDLVAALKITGVELSVTKSADILTVCARSEWLRCGANGHRMRGAGRGRGDG